MKRGNEYFLTYFTFTIVLHLFETKIVVANLVTGEVLTIKINILFRFVGNKNIAMYYYDRSKYSVRIVGDDSKYVGAG